VRLSSLKSQVPSKLEEASTQDSSSAPIPLFSLALKKNKGMGAEKRGILLFRFST
jgi:hypothetical protein